MPNRNVHIAPQRKKKRARRTSGGLTVGFSSLASPPWKGVLTKLKKYRWPIQVMPARMWNQRKIACRAVSMSGMRRSIGRRGIPCQGLSAYSDLCLTAPKTATYGVADDGKTQGLLRHP